MKDKEKEGGSGNAPWKKGLVKKGRRRIKRGAPSLVWKEKAKTRRKRPTEGKKGTQ